MCLSVLLDIKKVIEDLSKYLLLFLSDLLRIKRIYAYLIWALEKGFFRSSVLNLNVTASQL